LVEQRFGVEGCVLRVANVVREEELAESRKTVGCGWSDDARASADENVHK
jgi:hypothetical protein